MLVREDDPRVCGAVLFSRYTDNDTAVMLLHSRADMDALVAEVERLRAQRALDNDELARAYDMGRDKERHAAVAWLRWQAEVHVYGEGPLHVQADIIERGEHRREEHG